MFNQFTGIGYLAADPDSRFTQSGTHVVNFTVCCEYGYGEHKQTEFVRVVAWGKLADICEKYLNKGKLCMVQGSMQTRKWEDRDGNARYTTEIKADTIKMLSGPPGGSKSRDSSVPPQRTPDAASQDDDSVPF